ncbi:MAG: mismatch-specific DNA-glycosylase [Anaerolineae bacterium]|nr:mismatch-specific DNA-glycosylase [Anaerolineae bacterium]
MLPSGLRVVFCGTAAGARSAEVGAYYAGRGNKFWRTIYQIGLTPRLFEPHEFASLPGYGIGLTDIAKTYSGADKGLRTGHFDAAGLRRKIEAAAPRALAFNGKRAARAFYGVAVAYGQQPDRIGAAAAFVLPSTSGAASGFWNVSHWQRLAEFLAQGDR